ncbi:MAG: AAA family ATPase [Oscillospiraceae bacterium]|nr:AAA family ATPase [Oscillospiraceae bacterium]
MDVSPFVRFNELIVENCRKVIVGKDDAISQIVVCLIAGGHVLLEDVPGTGKTMLLRAFAKSLGGEFRRIQFTPDLLPSDLTGIHFFNQKQGEFEFRRGPLFANIILADEINRATPRSQSALLEVMEEKQITVDGETFPMAEPYMVMATQNPVESYGTFPLPEAQLDRFFMRLSLGYMEREDELAVLRRRDAHDLLGELRAVTDAETLARLRADYPQVLVSDDVAGYIMDLVAYTRSHELLSIGVSTRGALALYRAAQIRAAVNGRDFVIPEDVKDEAMCVLPHRLVMSGRSHLDAPGFVRRILDDVEVPLETR